MEDASAGGIGAAGVPGAGGGDFGSALGEDVMVVSLGDAVGTIAVSDVVVEGCSGSAGVVGSVVEAESSGWPVICAASASVRMRDSPRKM